MLVRLCNFQSLFRDAGAVVAKMNVLFDKDTHEKGLEEIMQRQEKSNAVADKLTQEEMSEGKIVKRAILDSVATGKVGSLIVDPNYLDFAALESAPTRTDEGSNSFFQLSETRLYIVLGCIAALLVVALLQAVCTIYKTSKSRKNQKVINP